MIDRALSSLPSHQVPYARIENRLLPYFDALTFGKLQSNLPACKRRERSPGTHHPIDLDYGCPFRVCDSSQVCCLKFVR
jgi:hypothetical protein